MLLDFHDSRPIQLTTNSSAKAATGALFFVRIESWSAWASRINAQSLLRHSLVLGGALLAYTALLTGSAIKSKDSAALREVESSKQRPLSLVGLLGLTARHWASGVGVAGPIGPPAHAGGGGGGVIPRGKSPRYTQSTMLRTRASPCLGS